MVKPRAIHIELNENGDVHISPTKKNVRAVRYLVNRTRKENTDEAMGGSAHTFDGFEELMESMLLGSLVQQHNSDPAKHLSMVSIVCVGLHVQAERNIYVAVVTTPSLLNPLRAMQHKMGIELYCDVTHKVSHHLVNVGQMAVNDVSGRGHVWGLMLQPHGTESGDYYKQMYVVLLGGMISFLDHFSSCGQPKCELCCTVEQVLPLSPVHLISSLTMHNRMTYVFQAATSRTMCYRPVVRQMLPDGEEPLPRFPWTSAQSDASDGWDHSTIDVLGLPKANKCATHLGIIGFRNGTHGKYIADRGSQSIQRGQ